MEVGVFGGEESIGEIGSGKNKVHLGGPSHREKGMPDLAFFLDWR